MQTIRKALKLSKDKYYEMHLSVINCLLPKQMTPKEIEVVAAFMSLEGDIASVRFGTSARKIVREKLKLSPAGLSNYITSLLDKGFLIEGVDTITILPLLIPEHDTQFYMFKFENIDAETITRAAN